MRIGPNGAYTLNCVKDTEGRQLAAETGVRSGNVYAEEEALAALVGQPCSTVV